MHLSLSRTVASLCSSFMSRRLFVLLAAGTIFSLQLTAAPERTIGRTTELRYDPASLDGAETSTFRLYPAVTLYIYNPDGIAFDLDLDVRDLNTFETGPREVLCKLYAPDGTALVRDVIADDGLAGSYQPAFAGWDHEMWYYGLTWSIGSVPMMRWSAPMQKERLARLPYRRFTHQVPAGKPGIYRLLLVGWRDHVVTTRLSGDLSYGVSGQPLWLHGRDNQFSKSYIYVPKGTRSLSLGFTEYDQPRSRRFTLTAPDGTVIHDGIADGGFAMLDDKRGISGSAAAYTWDDDRYDDKLLTLEVSDGPNDYMMHVHLNNPDRKGPAIPAFFCRDEATANALKGGAIYHDGQILWHPYQVRFHDWLKTNLQPEDYVPVGPDGEAVEIVKQGKRQGVLKGLPSNPDYLSVNGFHHGSELADGIMHDYSAHRNREALNLAIRDLAQDLNRAGPGDYLTFSGWNGNLAYVTSTHAWYGWRTAWRMLHEPDVPDEVKAIIREAFIALADRLAFAHDIERVLANGYFNNYVSVRYAVAATEDPLLKDLLDLHLERYQTGGWGKGVGMSPSWTHMEHFAHAYHYGGYIINSTRGPAEELGDARFAEMRDKLITFYQYMRCPEMPSNMWSSRTAYDCNEMRNMKPPVPWMGEGGPDLTLSVNDGGEFFAARRQDYYITTFHGRLAPMWLNNYFYRSRLGYGGGAITQFAVPGKGAVLVAGLNGSYGRDMQPHLWRSFHIHSLVGTTSYGEPLVVADSEHLGAQLDGNLLTSSGEVRDRPFHSNRTYTFGDDGVTCSVELAPTNLKDVLWKMGQPSNVRELYEMIPFVPWQLGKAPRGKQKVTDDARTQVFAIAADGSKQQLTDTPVTASAVLIDRGGFGVRIVLETPTPVHLGTNSTVLIEVARSDEPNGIPADGLALTYRLLPYQTAEADAN